MADTKVSALTSATPIGTDEIYLIDDPSGTPLSKRATVQSLLDAGTINNGNWSGTDLSVANGGTGASTLAAADIAELTNLASTANLKGAALIGIEDSGVLITATTVEGALAENRTAIDAIEAAGYITATLTDEEVQDKVGAMLVGTETGITVTYQDATADIDFVVGGLSTTQFTSANISQWTNDSAYLTAITGLAPDTATTEAAQPNITSLGTLTTLAVDNITVNGNTISSTAGVDLNITPLAGQQIVLDGTIVVDAGEVTGASSITSTTFVGALTGEADTVTTNANLTGHVTSTGNGAVLGVFTAAQLNTAVSDATVLLAADIGKQTIWIPAGAMVAATTSGAASGQVEETTNVHNYATLDFDASADEYACFEIMMPKSWDEGTITFVAVWSSTAVDTDGVSWALQAVAIADGADSDVAYGTAVVVDDANQSAAGEILISPESGAVTVAGSPAAGELTQFRFFRDVSDANDLAIEDAQLRGIRILYNTNALKDD